MSPLPLLRVQCSICEHLLVQKRKKKYEYIKNLCIYSSIYLTLLFIIIITSPLTQWLRLRDSIYTCCFSRALTLSIGESVSIKTLWCKNTFIQDLSRLVIVLFDMLFGLSVPFFDY